MAAFKVMSFNVRMDTDKDGENCWSNRRDVVAEVIRSAAPAVFGLQEPHKHQVEWLAEQLPEYTWCGKGRIPAMFGIGEEHNEYNPVFWRQDVLELTDSGTFWHSPTPFIPATKFEGAAFPRIATWAKLKFREDGRELMFVCTHLDHEGEEPRTRSAQLLVDKLPELAGEGTPIILVGDLNAGAESECYRILSSRFSDASCADGCCCAEGLLPHGTSTFCGYDHSIDSVIDFIFAGPGLSVASFGVVDAKQPSGCCASDHRPIVAELTLA